VAVQSRQAGAIAGTEDALLSQAISARDSIQGVNLDEEAANLIRYQQAYQAAAQVIAVADEVFQTLLAATRR
jgi:flagellar hook-associated protein 1 FlgK